MDLFNQHQNINPPPEYFIQSVVESQSRKGNRKCQKSDVIAYWSEWLPKNALGDHWSEKDIWRHFGNHCYYKMIPVKVEELEIILPFSSEIFIHQWEVWKEYLLKNFERIYPIESEQAALKELAEFSDNNEQTAIKIIHQSIARTWKQLFKLQNNERTTTKQQSSGGGSIESLFGAIDSNLH